MGNECPWWLSKALRDPIELRSQCDFSIFAEVADGLNCFGAAGIDLVVLLSGRCAVLKALRFDS